MEAYIANHKKSSDIIRYKYMTKAKLPVGPTSSQPQELDVTIDAAKDDESRATRVR